MGLTILGGHIELDREAEDRIVELADKALKDKYAEEYQRNLQQFRDIVFRQEVASMKKYLERKHPDQVNTITRLRAILNNERIN